MARPMTLAIEPHCLVRKVEGADVWPLGDRHSRRSRNIAAPPPERLRNLGFRTLLCDNRENPSRDKNPKSNPSLGFLLHIPVVDQYHSVLQMKSLKPTLEVTYPRSLSY